MRVRVAGLILMDDTLLLVKHVKGDKTYWLLPGGGVKLGENTRTALRREIKEEINLDGIVKDLIFVAESFFSQEDHIIQPTYLIEVKEIDNLRLGVDRRVAEVGFFRFKQINDLIIYPDIKDELKEFIKYRKCSRKYVFKKWIN
jgi:8-oxo-dGTP diphosphatase